MTDNPRAAVQISQLAGKYLLFSADDFSYLRREHRICGMMIGTLPQSPSQNVFLGLPIELMPEEVWLLVEKGVACVIDDKQAHEIASHPFDDVLKAKYLSGIRQESQRASDARLASQLRRRQEALQKKRSQTKDSSDRVYRPSEAAKDATETMELPQEDEIASQVSGVESQSSRSDFSMTPTTSVLLLPTPRHAPPLAGDAPQSYPLFRHLHEKGYYISPGIRFGCQYTVYPDDPLRFHSHFLANGVGWNEEIDLMDVVGSGRLGTGVKKGYLMGGQDPNGPVRAFSVEWAAM